jgi:hypothetical protein
MWLEKPWPDSKKRQYAGLTPLTKPDWFSIRSIVHDLELTSVAWKKIPVAGTFVDPTQPWERI